MDAINRLLLLYQTVSRHVWTAREYWTSLVCLGPESSELSTTAVLVCKACRWRGPVLLSKLARLRGILSLARQVARHVVHRPLLHSVRSVNVDLGLRWCRADPYNYRASPRQGSKRASDWYGAEPRGHTTGAAGSRPNPKPRQSSARRSTFWSTGSHEGCSDQSDGDNWDYLYR